MNRPAGWLHHPLTRAAAAFALILGAICLFLALTWPLLLTLGATVLLYATMSPAVSMLRRRDVSPTGAVTIVMLVVLPLLVGAGVLLFPLITAQVHRFALKMTHVDARLAMVLSQLNVWTQAWFDFSFDPAQTAHAIITSVSERARDISAGMAAWFSNVAFSLLLVPLLTFFLLRDFRALRNEAMNLLPNHYFELGWRVYNGAASQLQSYLRGIFVQAMVMAGISALGFWACGIDYAPLLGILVGLLNLIPFFGISLAKIPPVLVVLLSDEPNLAAAALALGVVFVAQAVDSFFVMPHIVARSANLHPLTVMVSVAIAGYHFGFAGLVLVVPILFSMKVIWLELRNGMRHFSPMREPVAVPDAG